MARRGAKIDAVSAKVAAARLLRPISGWVNPNWGLDSSQQAKVREIVPRKAPYLSIERLCLFIEETCAAIVDYELARGSPVKSRPRKRSYRTS